MGSAGYGGGIGCGGAVGFGCWGQIRRGDSRPVDVGYGWYYFGVSYSWNVFDGKVVVDFAFFFRSVRIGARWWVLCFGFEQTDQTNPTQQNIDRNIAKQERTQHHLVPTDVIRWNNGTILPRNNADYQEQRDQPTRNLNATAAPKLSNQYNRQQRATVQNRFPNKQIEP
jgi:hypothetical protein